MSALRVVEIIDAIAQFLVQPDYDEDNEDVIENIRNFRLVCRDFGAVGVRYLIPSVSVLRVPEGLDTANQVARHPVLRLYVKKLIYYHNTARVRRTGRPRHPNVFAIEAAWLEHFQTSQHCKLKLLAKAFPRLHCVEVRPLGEKAPCISYKLEKAYQFNQETAPSLEFLDFLENVDTFVLCEVSYWSYTPTFLAFLRNLKTLLLSDIRADASALAAVLGELPILEELQYSGTPLNDTIGDPNHALTVLPSNLKSLKLEHVDFLGESFPVNLRTLTLYRVSFVPATLPPTLLDVSFTSLQLYTQRLCDWSDIFLSLSTGCAFTVAGRFGIQDPNRVSGWLGSATNSMYLHCEDFVLDTFVGEILSNLLSSNNSSRKALTEMLFNACNAAPSNLYLDTRREIAIIPYFANKYQETISHECISPIAITGPHEYTLHEFHSCSGIVG